MKRWLCVLLASVCCATMLTGCAKNPDETKQKQEENPILIETTVPSDTEKPVINVVDGLQQTWEAERLMDLPAVTVSDDVDTRLALNVSIEDPEGKNVPLQKGGKFEVAQLGDYVIIYNTADSAGNKADEVRAVVTMVDTTAPVINLRGLETTGVEIIAKNTYTVPTPLVNDFSGYELNVKIYGTQGELLENDFDLYQKFLPMQAGNYRVLYTATQTDDPSKVTQAELSLHATEMGPVNMFETITDVSAWEKGGGLNPNSYAKLSLSTEQYSQGSASMKAVYNGVEGATANDRPGIYMYFSYANIVDISRLSKVAVDVYNANDTVIRMEIILMDAANKAYRIPLTDVQPGVWTTLEADIEAASNEINTENMMSMLLTVDGFNSGVRTMYYDNFRVIP